MHVRLTTCFLEHDIGGEAVQLNCWGVLSGQTLRAHCARDTLAHWTAVSRWLLRQPPCYLPGLPFRSSSVILPSRSYLSTRRRT